MCARMGVRVGGYTAVRTCMVMHTQLHSCVWIYPAPAPPARLLRWEGRRRLRGALSTGWEC